MKNRELEKLLCAIHGSKNLEGMTLQQMISYNLQSMQKKNLGKQVSQDISHKEQL